MSESRKSHEVEPTSIQINITRPVYTEQAFDERFNPEKEQSIETKDNRSLGQRIKRSITANVVSRLQCNIRSVIFTLFPILDWLPKYNLKTDSLADCTGGLTVGIMHIPQGLAFAMLASLPPVTGLYTALVPVLIYMLMGTSRYLSQGSFAVISLMVAQVCEREVLKMEGFDSSISSSQNNKRNWTNSTPTSLPDGIMWSAVDAKKIEISVSLALLIGLMQVVMGIFRLGFVAKYLSDPLISGFTTGSAVLVVLSQLKHIFGLKVPRFTGVFFSVKMAFHMLKNIPSSNVGSIITGVLSLAILIGLKTLNDKFRNKLPFPIPAELLVVIVGTAISYGGKINANFGVQILGKIPKGMPPISIPSFSLMQNMITDAFVISIVIFATNISLSKMFAKKNRQTIDANQELIAYGACNVGISFFSGFAICNALARTAVQENLVHTQLSSLVVIGLILMVLLLIAHLFFYLPKAILAAVVIANLIGLLRQFSRLKDLWKICRTDAIVWFVTCFGVILLGVDMGLGCGVLCAVLVVVLRSSSPRYSILGHVPDTDIFKDITVCSNAYELQGIKILRFESSLYYVNVEYFKSVVQSVAMSIDSLFGQDEKLGLSEEKGNTMNQSRALKENDASSNESSVSSLLIKDLSSCNNTSLPAAIHTIIIDSSAFTFIDSMGITTLKSLIQEYKTMGIDIFLANCSRNFQNQLLRGDFMHSSLDTNLLFVSIHDAVVYTISNVSHKLIETRC